MLNDTTRSFEERINTYSAINRFETSQPKLSSNFQSQLPTFRKPVYLPKYSYNSDHKLQTLTHENSSKKELCEYLNEVWDQKQCSDQMKVKQKRMQRYFDLYADIHSHKVVLHPINPMKIL